VRTIPAPVAVMAAAAATLAALAATAVAPHPVGAQEPGTQQTLTGVFAPQPSYGVRPGDQVVTDFFTASGDRLQVIAGTRTVDREGNLFFPYIGTVNVSGMDARAIRETLEARYSEGFYTDPVVDITVQLRVNVTGAVRLAGSYLVDPSSTVVDVLGRAGGAGLDVAVTSNQIPADPERVRLIRDGETLILDLRPETASPDFLQLRVQSGDWIFVPPQGRSHIRDEIQFWGSVLGFIGSLAAVAILIG